MIPSGSDRDRFQRTFLLLLVIAISAIFFTMIRQFLMALFLAAIFSGLSSPIYRWIHQKIQGPKGGIDLTERIRRATGLDVIDVSSEGGSTRAVFGKYVSERVLVKVEQGLSLDDTAAGVEIKIFRNFSGEATVRSDGSARAGFKWSLDY